MPAPRLPVLDHLRTLTDDVGIIQHAAYDIPNRSTGYCTDDVARAFIVAVGASAHKKLEPEAARLGRIYLSFLHDAQLPDGSFHNFLGYDRCWQDARGGEDSFGRALWALGFGMRRSARDSWQRLCTALFTRAIPQVAALAHPHAQAYAALGLAFAFDAPHADRAAIRPALARAVSALREAYEAHSSPGWQWLEPVMTYDCGRMCEALLRGGRALGDGAAIAAGLAMLAFYERIAIEDGTFVPIGNRGWYPRGGVRARFGQQPLEAAAVVDAGLLAYRIAGDARYAAFAEAGMAWFLGRNTASALLVTDGGCRDGIDEHGPSANMGAESTLAYLGGSLAMQPPVEAERSISTLR